MPPSVPIRSAALATAVFFVASAGGQPQPYKERYRPQLHFSPRTNWTNDPNGLIYFHGLYNLFFQYNPFGDTWGHMSWGHAVSEDLVHWRELPVALPEADGVMIFTGSTVADLRNTSGFCQGKDGCLAAVYTGYTGKTEQKPPVQTQNLAFSNDRGLSWTKYEGNPVLDLHLADFRDPKVFWSAASKQWIMVVSMPDDHKARFYGSPDLKKWTQVSEFGPAGATGGQWECPELFELPGPSAGETRWVLKVGLNPGGLQGGSGEQYFVGRFDGVRFTNDNPPERTLWTDYGKDCYCGLTFNNLPAKQPQVTIAWMNNWQYAGQAPTKPWRGQMTFPRALALKTYPDGVRLLQQPADAIVTLRESHSSYRAAGPADLNRQLKAENSQTIELLASTAVGTAMSVGWRVLSNGAAYTTVGYDARDHKLFVDRTKSGDVQFSDKFPARVEAPFHAGGQLKLHLVIDRSSVEVFAGDGQIAITNLVFPPEDAGKIEFYATGGAPGQTTVDVWRLRSIW